MKDKIKTFFRKLRKNIIEYITTNRLFITYVILSMLGLMLVRNFTIGKMFDSKPFLADFALVLMFGSLGYLVKPKNRFRYFFILMLIFTVMEVINSIYYTFYYSFASFGELSTVSQMGTVTNSLWERIKLTDLIYILIPIIFYILHKRLVKTSYYNFMSVVEKGKKMFVTTLLVGCIFLAWTFVTAKKSDYSRLAKQWFRVYIVERFGLVMYQCNDLIQTLTPKFSSLFGYEAASNAFTNFFTSPERDEYKEKNKYTNILKDKNIIFIHMEGMQTYLMDLKFNGKDVTPTINKLASEGLFFKNFYPQISTGTSSDTEFTLNTSLMPAASGTVFTAYYDRTYITIPKLLKEKGYETFSMHGNYSSMWNRSNVHPLLGYTKENMFFEEHFEFNHDLEDPNNMDVVNLGISDKLFFKQAVPILENFEDQHEKYMGTVITLSNHSPFIYLDKYGEFDMSTTFKDCDEHNVCTTKTTDYLYGKASGNYITSAHYADEALGEFFEYINNSDHFNNTVFVLYGDHDAKLTRNEMNYLYNYDYRTGELKDESDPTYIDYDSVTHELNKKTPLIIWTKNSKLRSKLNGVVNYYMGMYDVMPTIGNMLGINNDYALGHDIFNIKDNNVVVFPNGNFVTNLIYYNNSTGASKIIKEGAELTTDYISNLINKTEKILEVSNSIIVHNLIEYEGDRVKNIKEGIKE